MSEHNIISAISKKSMKAKHLRNIFAILGIILTTVLFTCIFTISGSWKTSMEESAMRQSGSATQGEFKYLSYDEFETIKQHGSIKHIGGSRIIAKVANPEISNHNAEVRCASNEWVAKVTYSMPTEGRLPKDENEIAMDTIMLKLLGIPCKIGENVIITYDLGEERVNDIFKLVGYWQGDNVLPASLVWVSKAYADKKLRDYVPMYEDDYVGTWNALVTFKNSDNLDKKFQNVILDSGYSLKDIQYASKDSSSIDMNDMDTSVLVVAALVLGIIILCGYLIISNIFSISIVNDIHSYALFKVIGMTRDQLRSVVRKQVAFLCLIGIPIGILAGYTVGYILAPYTFRILNVSVSKISVNPLIFIGSAIFSVITVFVSTHKSVKLVQQVSPITALRSTESNLDKKNKYKKRILSNGRMKLVKMAYANVFRYKKKSINVIISLALGMILLNIAYSISYNFDLDTYISKYINCDFMISDSNYFNPNSIYKEAGSLDQKKIRELSALDGIYECGSVYFSELLYHDDLLNERFQKLIDGNELEYFERHVLENDIKKESVNVHLYGVDKMIYNELTICNGNFNQELFDTGEYVLVSSFNERSNLYTYEPGDVISIAGKNGSMKKYKVMAIANVPYNLSVRHSHIVSPDFILPSKEYSELQGNTNSMLFIMNVNEGAESRVASKLDKYCKNAAVIDYISRNDYKQKFNNEKQMFVIVGIALSVILGLIGIINYLNSMITSIIVRRREFALMQCIGMSSKQLNQMIISEGLLYVGFTYLGVLTVGYGVGRLVLWVIGSQIWYMSSGFSAMASILCSPILIVIAMVIPYIGIHSMKKKSVIDRLGTYD